MDEPSIHDHETRIALIEQNCDRCPAEFTKIATKLDEIQACLINLKLKEAKSSGFRAAIFGTGGGAAVIGIFKAIQHWMARPQ